MSLSPQSNMSIQTHLKLVGSMCTFNWPARKAAESFCRCFLYSLV